MEELQVFQNAEFGQIRTVTINGEPWFVGKDVCETFGDTNYRRSLSNIDESDKTVTSIETSGGQQGMTVINESGLYALLFQMQPKKAKGVSQNVHPIDERVEKLHRFKRWVTHEVLPSIRQHGAYMTEQVIERTLTDPDYLIQLATTLKEERERRRQLELENAQKEQIIQEMQPKVSYYDLVLQSESLVPISKIAKDYGMSAARLNHILNELNVQYKMSGTWLLYQQHASQGYTQSKTHVVNDNLTVMHTYWTQKGRLFIYDLLKNKKGILPVIERNVEEMDS